MEKLLKINEVIDYISMTKSLTFDEVLQAAREWVDKEMGQ